MERIIGVFKRRFSILQKSSGPEYLLRKQVLWIYSLVALFNYMRAKGVPDLDEG